MTCNCGKPTRDDAYVCEDCLSDAFKALGEIPWLVEQLEITITRQQGAAMVGSSPASEKPMPYNVAAAESRVALRQTMFTWIKFCTEEHIRHRSGSDELPGDNLISMSRWLMWRVDGFAFTDLGFDACEELTNAVANCRRMVDRPPQRRYAGPCECGRDLYHKTGATQVQCRICERTYNIGELYKWMTSQVMGRLITAREGATLLSRFDMETKQATIDKWRERGRITERGHNPEGHRLYLFDDLLDMAARQSERIA